MRTGTPHDVDTDRPAEARSAGPGAPLTTIDPDAGALPANGAGLAVAEVYRPRTPWALFFKLAVLYFGTLLVTTGAVVGGWWLLIGPTDDSPPTPQTVVKVERVEVPVPGPAPDPQVLYVEKPTLVEPPVAATPVKKPPPDAEPVGVSLVVSQPKVDPPKVDKVDRVVEPPPPPPDKPIATGPPAEATALDGSYSGKAGAVPVTMELSFLADRAVRAKVTVNHEGKVSTETVTGQYDLVKGGANIALFVGDTAYTALVSGSELSGRVSEGGKNRGKLVARR